MTIKKAKRGVIECLGGGWDEDFHYFIFKYINKIYYIK